MCNTRVLFTLSLISCTSCWLLGAGEGMGSCAAYPFRSYEVHWSKGCPPHAPCCSEFGYCRPREEWDHGHFRDCNGVSNGTPLPPDVLEAEAKAGPYHGKPAGLIGPPPSHHNYGGHQEHHYQDHLHYVTPTPPPVPNPHQKHHEDHHQHDQHIVTLPHTGATKYAYNPTSKPSMSYVTPMNPHHQDHHQQKPHTDYHPPVLEYEPPPNSDYNLPISNSYSPVTPAKKHQPPDHQSYIISQMIEYQPPTHEYKPPYMPQAEYSPPVSPELGPVPALYQPQSSYHTPDKTEQGYHPQATPDPAHHPAKLEPIYQHQANPAYQPNLAYPLPAKPEGSHHPPVEPELSYEPPAKPVHAELHYKSPTMSELAYKSPAPGKPDPTYQPPTKPVYQPDPAYQPSTTRHTTYKSPTTPHTTYKSPTTPHTTYKSPTTPHTTYQPPSTPHTTYKPPTRPHPTIHHFPPKLSSQQYVTTKPNPPSPTTPTPAPHNFVTPNNFVTPGKTYHQPQARPQKKNHHQMEYHPPVTSYKTPDFPTVTPKYTSPENHPEIHINHPNRHHPPTPNQNFIIPVVPYEPRAMSKSQTHPVLKMNIYEKEKTSATTKSSVQLPVTQSYVQQTTPHHHYSYDHPNPGHLYQPPHVQHHLQGNPPIDPQLHTSTHNLGQVSVKPLLADAQVIPGMDTQPVPHPENLEHFFSIQHQAVQAHGFVTPQTRHVPQLKPVSTKPTLPPFTPPTRPPSHQITSHQPVVQSKFNERRLIHQSNRKPQLSNLHKSVQQALPPLDVPSSDLPDHQLHSMMAFVITEQTTPVSADVIVASSPTAQLPVKDHFLRPHPDDPSHFPPSQFPQPGHNLGTNVEIRNHGAANLQTRPTAPIMEPQPVFHMPHPNTDKEPSSIINRPLFDPTTVDLNTEDPHANHPVFQAVPDDHFQDQAQPPHPQVTRSLVEGLHHRFSVHKPDKAPMMAALPGTTIQCNPPDSSGSYTCDSFINPRQQIAARVTFPPSPSLTEHKRFKRKPENYTKIANYDQLKQKEINIEFDTVLNSKSTQLLKTIFQKNKEQHEYSVTEKLFPNEPVDLTPDENNQVLVRTSFQNPQKGNKFMKKNYQQTLKKKEFFKTPEILPSFTKSSNLSIKDPPLVPALAGTSVECELPDYFGSYSCTSFQNSLPKKTPRLFLKRGKLDEESIEVKNTVTKVQVIQSLLKTDGSKNEQNKDFPYPYKSTKSILEDIWKKSVEKKDMKINESKDRVVVMKNSEECQLTKSDDLNNNGRLIKTAADTSNKETKNTTSTPSVDQSINNYSVGNRQNDKPYVKLISLNDTSSIRVDIHSNVSHVDKERPKLNTRIKEYTEQNQNHKPVQQLRKELKEKKINKIMEDAVKRAIKYNRIQPTTKKPSKANKSTSSFRFYDPILNPVTGKPLGLVNKNTGVFYQVGHETFHQYYDVKSSTIRPQITTLVPTTGPYQKREGLPMKNIDESLDATDDEEEKRSFSTIDSLTKEFNSLINS